MLGLLVGIWYKEYKAKIEGNFLQMLSHNFENWKWGLASYCLGFFIIFGIILAPRNL